LKEWLAFGSVISATDPVSIISAFKEYTIDSNFYQLVYGESILNDAISIVFYKSCVDYKSSTTISINILIAVGKFLMVILGSSLIGYVTAYITAVFLKHVSKKLKQIEKIEVGIMIILPWVSYLVAEVS